MRIAPSLGLDHHTPLYLCFAHVVSELQTQLELRGGRETGRIPILVMTPLSPSTLPHSVEHGRPMRRSKDWLCSATRWRAALGSVPNIMIVKFASFDELKTMTSVKPI